MRRLIPSEPTALAPEGLVKSSNADTVLNTCNMAGQLGLLHRHVSLLWGSSLCCTST